jgi:antitoxin (DNA-binding transcriptional repressor) of toxin-antitoxin stability system
VTIFSEYGDYMNVGIREVKAHLSEYIRRVNEGEVVTITDRGRVTALLVAPNALSNVDLGLAEGWITPPARRGALPAVPRYRAAAAVAVLLDEDRDE